MEHLPTNIDITGYSVAQIATTVQDSDDAINYLNTQIGTPGNPGAALEQIQQKIIEFNTDDPRKISKIKPTPTPKYKYWTWFKIREQS